MCTFFFQNGGSIPYYMKTTTRKASEMIEIVHKMARARLAQQHKVDKSDILQRLYLRRRRRRFYFKTRKIRYGRCIDNYYYTQYSS